MPFPVEPVHDEEIATRAVAVSLHTFKFWQRWLRAISSYLGYN